jgi:hypothetical protein
MMGPWIASSAWPLIHGRCLHRVPMDGGLRTSRAISRDRGSFDPSSADDCATWESTLSSTRRCIDRHAGMESAHGA